MYELLMIAVLASQQESSTWDTSLNLHVVHQFEATLDTGGDVELDRIGGRITMDRAISSDHDLSLRFSWERDAWDFSGATGLAGLDPWDDIDTLDFSLQWSQDIDDRTQLFMGPILRFAAEDGASLQDGLIGGGMIGFAHGYSDTLTFGLGGGVVTQLEDDLRFFPVIVLDWKLSDQLRLTTDLTTRFGSRSGAELVWTPRDDWELGIGLAFEYSRFRLDDQGTAPDGAGEANAWPLMLRATWHTSSTCDISLLAGMTLAGSLEVINTDGDSVSEDDFDPTALVGIMGRIRF